MTQRSVALRQAIPFLFAVSLASLAACSTPIGRLRRDVEWLSSDALAGRKAGTPDAEKAARGIADRFHALGLKPAGDGGYEQTFKLPAARRLARTPSFSASSAGAAPRTAGAPADFAATLASAPGACDGVLIDVGGGSDYGAAWDKVAAGRRIALARFDPNAPPAAPDSSSPHATVMAPTLRTLAFQARQHQAAGLLIAVPSLGDMPAESDSDRSIGIPALLVADAKARALLEAAARGESYVSFDSGVDEVPSSTANVLGMVPAQDPDAEIIVVGAHYDHLGHGGTDSREPGSTAIHHGADDNASGTALMMELARRTAKRAGTLHRSILFAAWGAEEMGLLGSAHWVKEPTVPWARVAANLNFDMVGRSKNRQIDVGSTTSSTVFERVVRTANAQLEIPLNARMSKQLTGVGGSDHMSFLAADRPALFFFTGLHDEYHKPTDTAEKIQFTTMEEIADFAEHVLLALAAEPKIDYVKPPAPKETPGTESRAAEQGLRTWFGAVPDYGADEGGLVLSGVSKGSPAERAGILKGDVLTKLGPYKIDNVYDLTEALKRLRPGEEVEAQFKRGGESKTLKLTLAARR